LPVLSPKKLHVLITALFNLGVISVVKGVPLTADKKRLEAAAIRMSRSMLSKRV